MPATAPPRRRFSQRFPGRRVAVAGAVGAALLTAAVMAVAWALAAFTGRPVMDFTRDVAAVAGGPAYVGFVSQLTGLTWAAAAGAGLCGAVNQRDPAARDRRRFAAGLAALSGGLAVDDSLMFHEALLPAVGVPEKAVLLGHAGLAAAVFWLGRAAAWRTDPALLGCAAAGLGASVAIDQVGLPFSMSAATAVEDAAKLFGALAWAGYVLTAASDSPSPASAGDMSPA